MNRREWLTRSALTTSAALPWFASATGRAHAQPVAGKALKITDVKTILTAPAGIRLVVVKVMTSEPGLYGLGCATFTQRARVVETAIDKYLKPFLIGKDPRDHRGHLAIDLRQLLLAQRPGARQRASAASTWRCGTSSASGPSMPVYQLLGGKCREAVDTYRHASGQTFEEVEKAARALMEAGQRHVRVQVAVPGLATYGAGGEGREGRRRRPRERAAASLGAAGLRPHRAEAVRAPPQATRRRGRTAARHARARAADPGDAARQGPGAVSSSFFLEDPFSPEDVGYFEKLRQQTSTPIAMGELFNNPNEWVGARSASG